MVSAAGVSTLLLRLSPTHYRSPITFASPLPTHVSPFLHRRRPCSLTTACAAVQTQGTVGTGTTTQRWTSVPVSATGPATEDQSIFLITLDLSGAPDLVDAYTTPGQYLLTRIPLLQEDSKPRPAYICISSAPRSGLQFDLLVKSVAGTTSEQLCKLQVGDVVELGPAMGRGFASQHINPPTAAETVLLFAVGEGISPIRALIEFGFAATERADVRLYYSAKDLQSMPYQERFKKWEETGVKVVPLTEPIQETYLKNLDEIITNPNSTGAVIVGPLSSKEIITGVLLDFGVPHDKILTIEWSPSDPFASNV